MPVVLYYTSAAYFILLFIYTKIQPITLVSDKFHFIGFSQLRLF